MDSILTSVKKALGIDKEYNQFDVDITMHINSTFSVLTQLGVGPSEGFRIEDDTAEWSSFIGDRNDLNMVKTYVFQKVKVIFDPQSLSPAALTAYKESIAEYEWRLNVAADKPNISN